MDELVQDLGSSISLTQHTPVFNTWQEISDEEDDETEWKPMPKTSLPIQDSRGRPKLISWASEMSMYDGQSNHSLGKYPPPVPNINSDRYISALDLLQAQPGKMSQRKRRRNSLRKLHFHRGVNGKEGFHRERKLNFLQAVKGSQEEGSVIPFDETKFNNPGPRPALSNQANSEPANYMKRRLDEDVLLLSGSDKPCLSNRASQEELLPIQVLKKSSRMEEPVLDSVASNERNNQLQQGSSELSSIPNTPQAHDETPVSLNVSTADAISSPNQQSSFVEQSSEILNEHSSEWVPRSDGPGIPHHQTEMFQEKDFIMECKEEVEVLRKENIRLKQNMAMMREHSMSVEKTLRKVNERLVREITQLQRRLKVEQGVVEENTVPRSPMKKGLIPQGSPNEATPDGFQRSTYLAVSQGISPSPKSPSRIPSDMNFLKATKLGSQECLPHTQYEVAASPMEVVTPSNGNPGETNVEGANFNRQSVEKKDTLENEIEPGQKKPKKKIEPSPPNIKSSANSRTSSKTSDSHKNHKRKASKKDKEKKSSTKPIKPPVFDFTNLIVNYLPPEMDSTLLSKIFAPYGEIVSCKVVMDHKSGLSKGYGFVKFKTKEQAMRATEELDQYQIMGKVLKVACARKTERGGKPENKQTNLYIANLDKNIETEDIKRVFGSCGYVVQCKVLKDVRGVTRRIGFVRFDTHESALRAIKRYDGKKMEGTKSVIQVRFANIPKAPPSAPKLAPLQVNFPAQHAGQYISSIISQVDSSPQSVLPFSPNSLAGYVYGDLLPPASPQHHYSTSISPRNIGLDNAYDSAEDDLRAGAQPTNLSAACYVAGINATTQEAELKRTFDPEGLNRIKSVRVIRRRAGPYAFVNFFQIEDALEAVKTLDKAQMGAHTLTVRLR